MGEITRKPAVHEASLHKNEVSAFDKMLKELSGKNSYDSELSHADDILRSRLELQRSFSDTPSVSDVRKSILCEDEKKQIKEESGWSDEIIDALGSMEEYRIYKEAGLIEVEIGEKKCLIRKDIDWEQKDSLGRTNKERAEMGLSPINKDGKVIELHHIGQHADSPLAELTPEQHRGRGNDTVLHDKTKESEIDRQAFASERSNHWETRANEGSHTT